MRFVLALAQLVRGLAALAENRFEDAFGLLARLFDPFDAVYHYGLRFWIVGDLAESAFRAGRLEEARGILASIETDAEIMGAEITDIGVAYAHAVLAAPSMRVRLRSRARADRRRLAGGTCADAARLRESLAHAGRIADARAPLAEAEQTFQRLGADRGRRAPQELDATGGTRTTRPTRTSHRKQLEIARPGRERPDQRADRTTPPADPAHGSDAPVPDLPEAGGHLRARLAEAYSTVKPRLPPA